MFLGILEKWIFIGVVVYIIIELNIVMNSMILMKWLMRDLEILKNCVILVKI